MRATELKKLLFPKRTFKDFLKIIKISFGFLIPPYGIYLLYRAFKADEEQFKKNHELIRATEKKYIETRPIKIVDIGQVRELVSENEKQIIEYDKQKHHDLIRLLKFIDNLDKEIKNKYRRNRSSSIYKLNAYIILEGDTKKLESIVRLSVIMIKTLLDKKITDFLMIYEKFEELGAFRSSYENEMLNKLDNINNSLGDLSNKLKKLQSQMAYQNLVLTYNTFQLNDMKKLFKK